MEEKNIIDLRKVTRTLWAKRRVFFKVWIITFVLSCAWILPQPRSYDTSVKLAPESSEKAAAGALGNLASSFGFDMGSMMNSDAIYPLLYPDVVSSTDFIVSLLKIPVQTIDGDVKTDYMTYLLKHQKVSIWSYPQIWIKSAIKSIATSDDDKPIGDATTLDPFKLSNKETALVKSVQDKIRCSVDKKTDVITITVVDQDPLICATMADSVRTRLQDFITEYRTSKARIDVAYYTKMVDETYSSYQQAVEAYGRFCDTHRDVLLQTMQSQRDNLENDMQLKFNTYNVMFAQLNAAQAKVQERTPAFTILQNATVPVKASAPKRMIFVAAMLFLASVATALYVSRNDLHFSF